MAKYMTTVNRHAGQALLNECEAMRAKLRARLPRPERGDSSKALESYIERISAIRAMDHRELREAVSNTNEVTA